MKIRVEFLLSGLEKQKRRFVRYLQFREMVQQQHKMVNNLFPFLIAGWGKPPDRRKQKNYFMGFVLLIDEA